MCLEVAPGVAPPDEIRGLELKELLKTAEVLSFLFLSTLCLHHFLHEARGALDAETWRRFHEPLDARHVPPVVLQKIYVLIRRQWLPQLSIPSMSSKNLKRHDSLPVKSSALPWLHAIPSIQGWISITSHPQHDIGYPRSKRELWVSLSVGLLCFSISPSSAAPEACLAMSGLKSHCDGERVVLTHGGRADQAGTAGKDYISLALLKADGSWKECQFQQIELNFSPQSQENPQIWLQWLLDAAVDMNSV